MAIRIDALKSMLQLETAASEWFSKMSKKEQEAYLKAHPNSRIASDKRSVGKAHDVLHAAGFKMSGDSGDHRTFRHPQMGMVMVHTNHHKKHLWTHHNVEGNHERSGSTSAGLAAHVRRHLTPSKADKAWLKRNPNEKMEERRHAKFHKKELPKLHAHLRKHGIEPIT